MIHNKYNFTYQIDLSLDAGNYDRVCIKVIIIKINKLTLYNKLWFDDNIKWNKITQPGHVPFSLLTKFDIIL